METWGNILYLGQITDTQKAWEENLEREILGDKGFENLLHIPGSLESQILRRDKMQAGKDLIRTCAFTTS